MSTEATTAHDEPVIENETTSDPGAVPHPPTGGDGFAKPEEAKPSPVKAKPQDMYYGKCTGHSTSIDTGEAISYPMNLAHEMTLAGAFRVFKTYQPSASEADFKIDPDNVTDPTLRQHTDNGTQGGGNPA